MAVTLNVSLIIGSRMEHRTYEVEADGLKTLEDLFERADERKLVGRKFFNRLFSKSKSSVLTVLHNGRRLVLPDGLKDPLSDEDEVSLLTPTVGG